MTTLPDSIRAALLREGGLVTFARFMELALTDPQAGYYTSPERRLGETGDFTTAPRKVPAFNRAMAGFLAELVDATLTACAARAGEDGPVVLYEVGPGEGDLAAGVLATWSRERPDLRARVAYRLVELGEGLRRRQAGALETAVRDGWSVAWQPALPDPAASPGPAIVLTNELLDALPVHRLDVAGSEVLEAWVQLAPDERGLEERWPPASADALTELDRLFGSRDPSALRSLTQDGRLEVRPAIADFVRDAAAVVDEGFLVTIDYGDWLAGPEVSGPSPDEARPHRSSLRCFYRHQRRASPYDLVGGQDITADVDFRALALAGAEHGFEPLLFTGLGPLLRAMGLGKELARLRDEAEHSLDRDLEATALGGLVDEGGLGDVFKVMVQVREAASGPIA